MRAQIFRLLGLTLAGAGLAVSHPHLPHPLAPPVEGCIEDVVGAKAVPVAEVSVIVDGSHHPDKAVEILKALATKPNLRVLKIYGATEWSEDSLSPLAQFKGLEVLRIFDDSSRRKPRVLTDIAKVPTLKILQLYYSGD